MRRKTVFFQMRKFPNAWGLSARGAYNAITQFTSQQRASGVVTFSSGNHAQAIALSARELDTKAVILMPLDAPKNKNEMQRGVMGGERLHIVRSLYWEP